MDSPQKWNCDQCSLFYLSYENLVEHKKKHLNDSEWNCRYCNKVLSVTGDSRECYTNRKCETCEYRCSQCPQRFLRHSSLMNHENNHSQQKKKKPTAAVRSVKKKIINKKMLKSVDSEAIFSRSFESDVPNKRKRKPSVNPIKKQIKLQTEIPMSKYNSDNGPSNGNASKRSPLNYSQPKLVKEKINVKSTKQTEESHVKFIKTTTEKSLNAKNKTTSSTSNTQTTSGKEVNSVNYKPFSCHVCNDNFASESVLLKHIQSHGDAAKSFKCKYCAEKFDTIYDIQYHLAVCPLAEDELESTLINSTPPKFATKSRKSLNKPPSESKRGRPKKLGKTLPNSKEDSMALDTEQAGTPFVTTRNKRKSVAESTEPLIKIPKVTLVPVPTRKQRLPISVQKTYPRNFENEFASDSAQSDVSENDVSDNDVSDNLNDQFDESSVTGVKKMMKNNICPFPRCGMKFTREKALECHMRNHNDDFDDTLKCHKCDIPFDDIKSLRIHVDECQGLREEKDDDFSGPKHTKAEIQNVKTTRNVKSGGEFLCKTCGRTYFTMEKLKRHMAGHSSSNFLCRICKDDFANQTLLDQHFSDLHPTKTSYHCDTCKEDFISELFLKIHETEYHIPPPKTINREGSKSLVETKNLIRSESINSKVFNNSGYLQKIVINTLAKRDNNVFWCPVCFESYGDRGNLRDHFHSCHAFRADSVYVCELCDIEKPNAEMLCWHLEVHSNNKLSVNRFSKLRTCVSNVNIDNAENNKEVPKTSYNFCTGMTHRGTIKTKTRLNDLKLKKKTYLNTKDIKESTADKFISSKLKLFQPKKFGSQSKSKPLKKTKLNRLSSKKLLLKVDSTNIPDMMKCDDEKKSLLQVDNTNTPDIMKCDDEKELLLQVDNTNTPDMMKCDNEKELLFQVYNTNTPDMMKCDDEKESLLQVNNTNTPNIIKCDDETVGNNICKAMSVSAIKMVTKTVKHEAFHKFEIIGRKGIQEKHKKRYETKAAKTEIPNNIITSHEYSDNDNHIDNGRSKGVNDDSFGDGSSIEVKSTNITTANQSSEKLLGKETRDTSCQNDGSAHLASKEDSQHSFEAKVTALSINCQEDEVETASYGFITESMTGTSFVKPEMQSTVIKSILSKKGKRRFRNLRSTSPTKPLKHSLINNTLKCTRYLTTTKDSNPKSENEESNKANYSTESNLAAGKNSFILAKTKTLHLLDKKENKSHFQPSNIEGSSPCERRIESQSEESKNVSVDKISLIKVLEGSKNKKDFSQKIWSGVTKKNKFLFPDVSPNKIKPCKLSTADLKNKAQATCSIVNKSLKIKGTVVNILKNFDSSGMVAFCSDKNVVPQTDTVETYVRKPDKLRTSENLQETVNKRLSKSEKMSPAVSAGIENLEQNDNPVDDDFTLSRGVHTNKSTSLQSEDRKDYQSTEDSKYESNELFEVACDKCSLKFYNQDDLFDHIGSHYDI